MPTLYDNFSQVRQYIDQEKPDLTSYVTKTELANCSYVTISDLNNYLPITGGNLKGNLIPSQSASYNLGSSSNRWKEIRGKFVYTDTAYLQDTSYSSSIVPNTTATYTLGDESHLYSATYSARLKVGNNSQIYNDGGGITFSVNSNNGIRIGGSTFYPKTSGGYSNGSSTNYWNSTYTSRVDLNSNIALTSDGSGLFVKTAGNLKFSFDADSFHPYGSTYSGVLDLGTSTRTWRSTYTNYLYLNENKVYIYSGGLGQIKFGVNGADRFRINYNTFEPSISGTTNLGGGTSNPFTNAYLTNLYLNGTNIEDRFTYLVWTGTSAEYAALSDYTTYQLYLIKNE